MDFTESGEIEAVDARGKPPYASRPQRPSGEGRSLGEWLRVLRDGWPALVLLVLLGIGAGIGATLVQHKEYESKTTLVTSSSSGFLNPEFASGLSAVTATVTRLAGSAAVLRGAASDYVAASPDTTTRARRQSEASLDWMSSHLQAQQVADSGIVELSGRAQTQADARALTEAGARSLERAIAGVSTATAPAPAAAGKRGSRTTKAVAGGASLRNFQTRDEGQVSPTPVRNLLLGGNAGLVLGIVAGLALGATRRRVRRPDEMVAELGIPVLGSVGRSRGPGINPGLSAARARLQRLRDPDQGTVFLLTGTASQERTAELAEELARAFSASSRTVLVDADLDGQFASRRLRVDGLPGLGELLNGQGPSQHGLYRPEQVLVTSVDGANGNTPLAVLPAGEPTADAAAALSGGALVRSLKSLRLQYEFVLVVGPGLDRPAEVIPLVSATDWSVLVTPRGQRAKTLDAAHGMADALAGRVAGALIVDRR